MNLEFIFKVIDKDEWQEAKQSGTYGGSEKDLEDGYIHFSEEDQVEETLNKHYPKKENLVLLRVNEAGKKEKINVQLVRDTFKVPNKFYEGNLRRQLEFFFPENLKEIFPENELSPNKRRGTSI